MGRGGVTIPLLRLTCEPLFRTLRVLLVTMLKLAPLKKRRDLVKNNHFSPLLQILHENHMDRLTINSRTLDSNLHCMCKIQPMQKPRFATRQLPCLHLPLLKILRMIAYKDSRTNRCVYTYSHVIINTHTMIPSPTCMLCSYHVIFLLL